jgi:hypothetical protein
MGPKGVSDTKTDRLTVGHNINSTDIKIFQNMTYLMGLPEDGPRLGPKHVAAIK